MAAPKYVIKGRQQIGGTDVVGFYSRGAEYSWMANTHRGTPVTIDGEEYKTTEHYFHTQKFVGDSDAERKYRKNIQSYGYFFGLIPNPFQSLGNFPAYARKAAKKYKLELDSAAWDARSPALMRKAVAAKLDQHSALQEKLLKLTENTVIIESTTYDNRWGDGGSELGKPATGQNLLGRIYMEELLKRRYGSDTNNAQAVALRRYNDFNTSNRSQYKPPFFDRHPHLKTALQAFLGGIVVAGLIVGGAYAAPAFLALVGLKAAAAVVATVVTKVVVPAVSGYVTSVTGISSATAAAGVGFGALGTAFASLTALVGAGISKIKQLRNNRKIPKAPAPGGSAPAPAPAPAADAARHDLVSNDRRPGPDAPAVGVQGVQPPAAVPAPAVTPNGMSYAEMHRSMSRASSGRSTPEAAASSAATASAAAVGIAEGSNVVLAEEVFGSARSRAETTTTMATDATNSLRAEVGSGRSRSGSASSSSVAPVSSSSSSSRGDSGSSSSSEESNDDVAVAADKTRGSASPSNR